MLIERQYQTEQPSQLSHGRHAGFTLVELMVVVAVIAVLAVIAAPGMSSLLNANKSTGAAGELTTILQIARSEAIRRNGRVWICPTDGSATAATVCSNSASWDKWAILDLSKADVKERVIQNGAFSGSVKLKGPAAGIMFKPSGLIENEQKLEVSMSGEKRCLTVLISGAVTLSKEACP